MTIKELYDLDGRLFTKREVMEILSDNNVMTYRVDDGRQQGVYKYIITLTNWKEIFVDVVDGKCIESKEFQKKQKFFRSKLGIALVDCITSWDNALASGNDGEVIDCQLQWYVYSLAIKDTFGTNYRFSRTDDYFGLCTDDMEDWLFKVERGLK